MVQYLGRHYEYYGCAGLRGAVCRWGRIFSGRAVAGVWLAGVRMRFLNQGAAVGAQHEAHARGIQSRLHQRKQL